MTLARLVRNFTNFWGRGRFLSPFSGQFMKSGGSNTDRHGNIPQMNGDSSGDRHGNIPQMNGITYSPEETFNLSRDCFPCPHIQQNDGSSCLKTHSNLQPNILLRDSNSRFQVARFCTFNYRSPVSVLFLLTFLFLGTK